MWSVFRSLWLLSWFNSGTGPITYTINSRSRCSAEVVSSLRVGYFIRGIQAYRLRRLKRIKITYKSLSLSVAFHSLQVYQSYLCFFYVQQRLMIEFCNARTSTTVPRVPKMLAYSIFSENCDRIDYTFWNRKVREYSFPYDDDDYCIRKGHLQNLWADIWQASEY